MDRSRGVDKLKEVMKKYDIDCSQGSAYISTRLMYDT